MKYAVCKHLMAHGKVGKTIAKTLLNLHTGKSAEYNAGGKAFTPGDVEQFGLWWDRTHHDFRTHKPLTRPCNMGSVQNYFNVWRADLDEQLRIDNEPEPVYEPLEPLDAGAPSIFDALPAKEAS